MKNIKRYVLIWSFVLSVFLIPILGRVLPFKPILLNFQFITSEDMTTSTEKVMIGEISKNANVSTEGFVYNEEKDRYECMAENAVGGGYFNVILHPLQLFSCTWKYRLADSNADVDSRDYILVTVYRGEHPVRQEKLYLTDFEQERNTECVWGYNNIVLIFFIFAVLWIVLSAIIYQTFIVVEKSYLLQMNKSIIKNFFVSPYIMLILFAVVCFCIVYTGRPPYETTPDTGTYVVKGLTDLSWSHRTPGYQMIILCLKWIFKGKSKSDLFTVIVRFQMVFCIVSMLFFYDALRKILKNDFVAYLFGNVYVVLVSIYGYTELIMTESMAVSLMCILIWMIVKGLETEKKRYMIGLNALMLISTLTRPSFVFLYPIVLVFIWIHYLWKRNREMFVAGVFSFLAALILLLGYCEHNKQLTGQFMLSDVSYHNQMAIMISSDCWRNAEYPEITAMIEEQVGTESPLYVSMSVCDAKGYVEVASYIKSCIKMYYLKLISYFVNEASKRMSEPIILIYGDIKLSTFRECLFEAMRVLLLPANYAIMLLGVVGELLYCLGLFIKKKELLFMPIGIAGCIFTSYIVSVVSLTSATLQRYMIHLLPAYLMLEAIIIMQITAWLRKKEGIEAEKCF